MTVASGKPALPTAEAIEWTLLKDGRCAKAAIRMRPDGIELRIYIDGRVVFAHAHRHYAIRDLQAQCAAHREDLEGLGWQSQRQRSTSTSAPRR